MPDNTQNLWAMLNMNPQDPAGIFSQPVAAGTVPPLLRSIAQAQTAPSAAPTPKPISAPRPQIAAQADEDPYALQYYKQLMQERLGGIKGMEKQLDQAKNASMWDTVNLSPLLAWGDAMGHTNMAHGYQAPPSRQEMVDKLQKAIAGQKQAATGDFLKLMNQENQAKTADALMDYRKALLGLKDRGLGIKEKTAEQKGKGMKIPANTVLKANEGNAIPQMLEDVGRVVKGNLDLFDPVRGRLRSYNPYDTRVQSVNSEMRAVSQAFGKFMEGGVLRKEDEEKYRKMFPNVGDTPEVAQVKLDNVKRLLIQKQNSDISALRGQGYNTAGLEKGFRVPNLNSLTLGSQSGIAPATNPAASGGVLSPEAWLAQRRGASK